MDLFFYWDVRPDQEDAVAQMSSHFNAMHNHNLDAMLAEAAAV